MFSNLRDKKTIGIILFAVAIVVIYGYRLNFPPEPYYDEVHYVRFLKRLIHEHRYDHVSPHPPLWHLLTLPCVLLFGEQAAAWRIVSLSAGLLLVLWVYLLAKKISKDSLTAMFALFFFTFDCISFTQARIGMLSSLALLFMVLSFWAFLHYWPDQRWPRRVALLSTGFFLGLALSTKLTAMSMVLIIYFLIVFLAVKKQRERKQLIFESILFLVLLPLVIYVCVHAFIPFLPGCSWKTIWKIQKFNFRYHFIEARTQTHGYASQWWGWPLLLRPIWFYYASQAGIVRGIICIGNPVIFWTIPLMLAYLCWEFVRRKNRVVGLILLGFFGQWLFYASGTRLEFFHYFYFAMPFVAMGLAWICRQAWDKGEAGKILVCLYLAFVVAMFIYWYPLLSGLQISEGYYRHHIWFPSWI